MARGRVERGGQGAMPQVDDAVLATYRNSPSSSIIETVRDNPDHVVKQSYALSTPEDLSFDVPSTETAVVESKVVPI